LLIFHAFYDFVNYSLPHHHININININSNSNINISWIP
jgi:hypothetical protein